MNKKYLLKTYGCQMNAHDSEKIKAVLAELGFAETKEEANCDLAIFNTCCIRENAENKVYGNLGYLKSVKKTKPELKIILCGCMMQQDEVVEKIRNHYPFVDVVLGTFNLHQIKAFIEKSIVNNERIIEVKEEFDDSFCELPYIRERKHMSSVNIMYGCNNFCSYCVVPYVRGREKSRKHQELLTEIQGLVQDGVRELMLLGQNVNSYGDQNYDFSALLQDISKVEGLERVRFMTSHPKDLSDQLIETIASQKKICKHFHLPLQSGSNAILDKMNRGYTREHYKGLVEKLHQKRIAITTDIIVGFPGETEEDFLQTLDMVKACSFSGAYTFIFSKRKGTPAYEMEDQVPEEVVKERFQRLMACMNPILLTQNQALVGKTLSVLVDEKNKQKEGFLTGRTDDNRLIHFKGAIELIGTIVDVKVTDVTTFYLNGIMC